MTYPEQGIALTELSLRRVRHPMATDNYRVIWNGLEVGSVGIQQGAAQRTFWAWGIDTPANLPFQTHGEASDRGTASQAFKTAWEAFASDRARLLEFVQSKIAVALRAVDWGNRPPLDAAGRRDLAEAERIYANEDLLDPAILQRLAEIFQRIDTDRG